MVTPPVFAHPAPRARPNAPFKSLCAFFLRISRKTAHKSRKVAICAHLAAFRAFQSRKNGVLSPFRSISAQSLSKRSTHAPSAAFRPFKAAKNGVLSPFRTISAQSRLKRSTHALSAIFRPFWRHQYVPTPLASDRCPIIHSPRGVTGPKRRISRPMGARLLPEPTDSTLVSGGLKQLKTPISSPFCALCGAYPPY